MPSTIIEKARLRIGLIGVTAAFADFYKLLGWHVTDPLKAVAEQAALMKEKVDVLVVMSHLGLPMDRRMAQEIAGIDLILGGHTHHLLEEPEYIGQTCICAAGKFGEYIGRVEIGIDPITARPTFRASCVPVAALEEQPEAAAIISGFKDGRRAPPQPGHCPAEHAAACPRRARIAARQPACRRPAALDGCRDRHRQRGAAARRPRRRRGDGGRHPCPLPVPHKSLPHDAPRQRHSPGIRGIAAQRIY